MQHEIDEMEKLMRQFEDLDDREKGDLWEDFVLTATEVRNNYGARRLSLLVVEVLHARGQVYLACSQVLFP